MPELKPYILVINDNKETLILVRQVLEKDLSQRILGPGRLAESMGSIGDELGGHLGRRQLTVH